MRVTTHEDYPRPLFAEVRSITRRRHPGEVCPGGKVRDRGEIVVALAGGVFGFHELGKGLVHGDVTFVSDLLERPHDEGKVDPARCL